MNIPYGKQYVTQEDLEIVKEVLLADFLTQGPEIAAFEADFALKVGAEYALAVSNGTAALHLCAMALDVKEGTRVLTTPITFAASANCVRYCGGELDFVDIDPDTYLMDLDLLEKKLRAKPAGYYSGVIPVQFGGLMVDLKRLRSIADEYKLWIIEDACHAPGAYFDDNQGLRHYAGQGDLADCSVFSFHPVKHIASGEGGMITTARKDVADRIALLRTHGITKDPEQLQRNDGPWYYEMQDLGYNYRITDFQCALGRSQLKRLDWSLERRNEIASVYQKAFDDASVRYQKNPKGHYNAYHLFVIEVDDRKNLYLELRNQSIFAQVHYVPVHRMPYYEQQGWREGDLPMAERYYSRCLSLPMFPTLTDQEQKKVIDAVINFVK